jgi:phosphatidylinositol-3-phosphatase
MKTCLLLMCVAALLTTAAVAGTVAVTAPLSSSTVTSPVKFAATATTTCAAGISSVGIYTAPYQLAYVVNGASLNTSLTLSPGTYNTVVQEWDNCGGYAKTPITINVVAASAVKVTSPVNGSAVLAPVQYSATATTTCSKGVASVGIYTAPYQLAYVVNGASLNTSLSLSPGTYNTVVQEWDNCGGYAKTPITIAVGGNSTGNGTVPASSHVFVVVEENHSYSSVIGSSSMPYLNSLVSRYGLATQYYANTHPSIGNYLMLTTGQIISNDDTLCSTLTQDNLVRQLMTAGKTWKAYAESLPSVGYTGCDVYPYVKRHNPLSYFSDVVNSSSEKLNLVPFTQFATDLKNGQLPNFSFIVPNVLNDAHDGTLTEADRWLQNNIAPLLASSQFQTDGILVIVFDESVDTDTTGGGGHVAALVIGPKVKAGYKSTTNYQHQNTLKTLLKALGLTTFPGSAGTANDMGELF